MEISLHSDYIDAQSVLVQSFRCLTLMPWPWSLKSLTRQELLTLCWLVSSVKEFFLSSLSFSSENSSVDFKISIIFEAKKSWWSRYILSQQNYNTSIIIVKDFSNESVSHDLHKKHPSIILRQLKRLFIMNMRNMSIKKKNETMMFAFASRERKERRHIHKISVFFSSSSRVLPHKSPMERVRMLKNLWMSKLFNSICLLLLLSHSTLLCVMIMMMTMVIEWVFFSPCLDVCQSWCVIRKEEEDFPFS